MAEYVEQLDLDTPDGNSIMVAAWDEGDNVEIVIISKDTQTWPDDDGLGNLGQPQTQTGVSAIHLNGAEVTQLIGALMLSMKYKH